MEKTTITMAQHYAMFQTIAQFFEEKTNLDTLQAADVAGNLLTKICDNANIEMVLTEGDEEFLMDGLMGALLGAIFGEDEQ